MKLVRVPIDDVQTWAKNPRMIKKKDYERLKKQIQDLGFYKPLVACQENGKYTVLGGNMRLRVLKELQTSHVDLTIVEAATEDRKIRFSLSDNDRAGEWDDQALAELVYAAKDSLPDLDNYRLDLGPTINIDKVLNDFGPTDSTPEDTVPKPETQAVSKQGDLYALGRHRLFVGDSTKPEAFQALLQTGEPREGGDNRGGWDRKGKADLVFTDPPYNVNYHSEKFNPILSDNKTEEAFIAFTEAFMERIKENTKRGGVFYICSGYLSYPTFIYAIKKTGMVFSCPIIWVKNAAIMAWNDYRHKHEMVLRGTTGGGSPAGGRAKKAQPILYGWNGGRHYFQEARFEADVWELSRRATNDMMHPTQKPLALIQRAIRNSSKPGELVLDPFAGSGGTIIASEREGRTCAAIELDPVYADVCIRRFAAQGGPGEDAIRATRRRPGQGDAQAEKTITKGKRRGPAAEAVSHAE